jgi:hypothetical protein
MKKIIYIALLAISSSLIITSCTDEEVTPATELNNGGTGSSGGEL